MISVKRRFISTFFVAWLMMILPAAGLCQPNAENLGRQSQAFSQLSLDFGPFHGAVAYAGSVSEGGIGLGVGAGFSWQELSLPTDKNILDVLHGEVFLRFHPGSWIFIDLGATVMRYAPFDDSSERGTFFGGYLTPMVGWKWIFVGPQAAIGRASDLKGSDFIVALRPLVLRLALRF